MTSCRCGGAAALRRASEAERVHNRVSCSSTVRTVRRTALARFAGRAALGDDLAENFFRSSDLVGRPPLSAGLARSSATAKLKGR